MAISRSMELDTPLGADVLLFHRMHARDELSRSSEFYLELLSESTNTINFDEILGKNVTVRVKLQDGSTRYFNGYVTRFGAAGRLGRYLRYTATVSPWAWFMTRTTDCRIFQEKTVRQILEDVFADHSMADFKFELTESYETWNYCVQYRESDFNFVSRLMEHEGIFYYYRHIDGAHTMVLTDSVDKCVEFPGYDEIKFVRPQELVRPEIEHINSWEFSRHVQPGVFSLDDYDFERPGVDLRLSKPTPRNYKPSDYEWFEYPGLFTKKKHGEQLAQIRGEEFGSQFERAFGKGNARGIHVGSIFKLDGFTREDQNVKHLVVSSTHDLQYSDYEAMPDTEGSGYECSFEAMSTVYPFRPRRITPKPFVQGPQTAVVVGPGEIHTDKYGRVKVQFFWDSRGKNDEQSSCWMRVSHPWAGKSWGAISTPRVGQEVIVDFLEGDPDQPIITGRVYNQEQMPPYELPANKTQSGIVTRSSTGGSPETFNELCFEDKKGSELIYLRAEKDYTNAVENDEVRWVGHDKWIEVDNDETTFIKHDRTETIDNDETITIHGKRTEEVDKDETITIHMNRTETVDKDEKITVSGNRDVTVVKSESKTVGLQRTHAVGVNETIVIGAAQEVTIGGLQSVAIGGMQTFDVGANQTVSVGGNRSLDVKGNQTTKITKDDGLKVEGARTVDIGKDDTHKVAKKLMITVGESIMLKTGDASIAMKKDGSITIKGKNITIEGSGEINVKASKDLVMKGSKIAQN